MKTINISLRKKLTFLKESLRTLTESDLGQAVGGSGACAAPTADCYPH